MAEMRPIVTERYDYGNRAEFEVYDSTWKKSFFSESKIAFLKLKALFWRLVEGMYSSSIERRFNISESNKNWAFWSCRQFEKHIRGGGVPEEKSIEVFVLEKTGMQKS